MHDIDPSNSTSLAVSRKGFVALSGAALAGTSLAQASAQSMELGKTHPPLVPEDDPAIVAAWIPNGDGLPVRTYTARPKVIAATTPGVVITMHVWGVDTSMRDVARRLAKAGYIAAIPDLYDGLGAPNGDGLTDYSVFGPFREKIDYPHMDSQLRGGATWIHSQAQNAKVATMGFCMGGSITWHQPVENPGVFSAAAIFYGNPTFAESHVDQIKIPIFGGFGERDTSIPADQVRALAAKLTVPTDIKIYAEAGHAFMDDQRQSYVPSAAADAWERLLAFYAKYLSA